MRFVFKYITLFTTVLCFFIHSSKAQQLNHTKYQRSEKEANEIVRRVLKTNPVVGGHNDVSCSFCYGKTCPRDLNDFRLDSINNGNTNILLDRKGGVIQA